MGSHGSSLLWLVSTASVQMEADSFLSGWWAKNELITFWEWLCHISCVISCHSMTAMLYSHTQKDILLWNIFLDGEMWCSWNFSPISHSCYLVICRDEDGNVEKCESPTVKPIYTAGHVWKMLVYKCKERLMWLICLNCFYERNTPVIYTAAFCSWETEKALPE